MDSAPYSINESSSVKRCYRLFRTMGLRHLTVVDGDHRVTGIVTRKDITESRLHEHWSKEVCTCEHSSTISIFKPLEGQEGRIRDRVPVRLRVNRKLLLFAFSLFLCCFDRVKACKRS
jgi:hypothetical protein